MNLRKLEEKDANLMLEWMHDRDIVKNMHENFLDKTLEDCLRFIGMSKELKKDVHMAITDENDEYMGTVSLKNISDEAAEFAIAIRKVAMGKGFSKYGMSRIISYGFNELDLKLIYWYVDVDNKRAINFYDKNGYEKVDDIQILKVKEKNALNKRENVKIVWYVVSNGN